MDVKLVMFKADGQRKDFPLINETTVIGRGDDCELRVPLLAVSRKHCELSVSGNAVKVKDLASSNGTYVNNRRVNEQALAAGDRLVVGPVVFTVQVDGKPESIRPVKLKAPQAPVEEIVDLEGEASASGESAMMEAPEAEEEIDVISALEMMAGEPDAKKKKKQ